MINLAAVWLEGEKDGIVLIFGRTRRIEDITEANRLSADCEWQAFTLKFVCGVCWGGCPRAGWRVRE